jgi:hypothetical protein
MALTTWGPPGEIPGGFSFHRHVQSRAIAASGLNSSASRRSRHKPPQPIVAGCDRRFARSAAGADGSEDLPGLAAGKSTAYLRA